MKKKVILSAFIVLAILAVVACGNSGSRDAEKELDKPSEVVENISGNSSVSSRPAGSGNVGGSSSEKVPDKSGEAVEDIPGDSSSESQPAGSGDLGDYHVEIKGAALAQDYEGKPVIVVTYAWTNNSDDTKSAMFSVNAKAFQDGVELESAFIMDKSVCDTETSTKEVRPGTTIDVQWAYVLDSEMSIVEFELTELISFSGDAVTMDFDPATLA